LKKKCGDFLIAFNITDSQAQAAQGLAAALAASVCIRKQQWPQSRFFSAAGAVIHNQSTGMPTK